MATATTAPSTSPIQGSQVHISIGLDIASSGATNADRAALAVLRTDRLGTRVETAIAARGLRPSDLVTKTVAMLRALDAEIEDPRRTWVTLAVDRTGDAGTAEMLEAAVREAAPTLRCKVTVRRVWIAAGDGQTPPAKSDPTDRYRTKWSVGREFLVNSMISRLRQGALDPSNAQGDGASVLQDELRGLVQAQTGRGRSRVDHKKGSHDDVVMAVCLADWAALSRRQGGYSSGSHPLQVRAAQRSAGDRPADLGRAADLRLPPLGPVSSIPTPRRTTAASKYASKAARRDTENTVLAALPPGEWVTTFDVVAAVNLPSGAVLGALHGLAAARRVERSPADPHRWRRAA